LEDGVQKPAIKIQLLLGGEKTETEVLWQALEIQAVLLAARIQNQSPKHTGGPYHPQPGEVTKEDRRP
jgi:hypothetical protein